MIGTPLYMSPEQAEMSGLDIDTPQRHLFAGRAAVRVADRHDAVRPTSGCARRRSTRSAGSSARKSRQAQHADQHAGAKLRTSAASRREIDPDRLSQLVRGDLDWIVMKCLEKDRTRRYETANALALDVQRHLDDEPVEAGPPSKAPTGSGSSPSEIASCSPFCLRRRWWCSWAWLVWLSATS